ncbi:MAG: hypothetical protein M5T52_16010 [Ignavibacteriaceae bacterium]|nr:hypothetical protein [Ignavibacteriaceae bacterium]
MYDIVIKEETEKELIVLVINDTKEEKLEEEFEKEFIKILPKTNICRQ